MLPDDEEIKRLYRIALSIELRKMAKKETARMMKGIKVMLKMREILKIEKDEVILEGTFTKELRITKELLDDAGIDIDKMNVGDMIYI